MVDSVKVNHREDVSGNKAYVHLHIGVFKQNLSMSLERSIFSFLYCINLVLHGSNGFLGDLIWLHNH